MASCLGRATLPKLPAVYIEPLILSYIYLEYNELDQSIYIGFTVDVWKLLIILVLSDNVILNTIFGQNSLNESAK